MKIPYRNGNIMPISSSLRYSSGPLCAHTCIYAHTWGYAHMHTQTNCTHPGEGVLGWWATWMRASFLQSGAPLLKLLIQLFCSECSPQKKRQGDLCPTAPPQQ